MQAAEPAGLNLIGGLGLLRWIYLAIVVLIAAATLIFALQNLQIVSVAFLSSAISAPLALVVFVVYVLGAVTGGGLYALLRRSVKGSRRAPTY
jgi:putative membrane protein